MAQVDRAGQVAQRERRAQLFHEAFALVASGDHVCNGACRRQLRALALQTAQRLQFQVGGGLGRGDPKQIVTMGDPALQMCGLSLRESGQCNQCQPTGDPVQGAPVEVLPARRAIG